jgi:hypothetical protein
MKVYLIGSLRNPQVPLLGKRIRALGFDVFDDWFGAGEIADDSWQAYEEARGRHYGEALYGRAAENIFQFDLRHLNSSDLGVLMLPAGKSGHLELGYLIGQGKPGLVLFPEVPSRWDVMYQLADGVFFHPDALLVRLKALL